MADESAAQQARSWLAFSITIVSILGVIGLAVVMIVQAKDQSGTATQVLSTVLPVIGTWVGTILAFYFGKENYETAAKSVGDLAKQLSPQERLRSIPVKAKMIPRSTMFFKTAPIDALTISSILADLEKEDRGDRLPVLTDKSTPKYIIHRSMLDRYLTFMAGKGTGNISTLTFANLVRDRPDLEKLFATSFATVKEDATLADAQAAMEHTPNCEDVFVTTTSGEVVGWVTDNIIQRNLQS